MPIIKFNGTEYSSVGKGENSGLLKGAVVRGEPSSEGDALIYLAATAKIDNLYTDNNGVFLITEGYGDIVDRVQGILSVNVRQRASGNFKADISWEYVSNSVKLDDYFIGYKLDSETNLVTINLYMIIHKQYDSRIITLLTEGALNGAYNDVTKWNILQGGSTIGTERPEGFTYVESTLNTLANPVTPERIYVQNKTGDTDPGYFKIATTTFVGENTSSLLLSVRFNSNNMLFGILSIRAATSSTTSYRWIRIEWQYLNTTDANTSPLSTLFEPNDFFVNYYVSNNAYVFDLWVKKKLTDKAFLVEKISDANEVGTAKWDMIKNPVHVDSAPTGGYNEYANASGVMRNPAKSLWLPEVNGATNSAYDDLDKYTENGRWYIKYSSNPSERPANMPWGCTDGWLEVQANASGNILQVFYRCGTKDVNDQEAYRREKFASSAGWTEWRKFQMASVVRKNIDLNEFRVEGSYYIEDTPETSAAHHLPDGARSGWLDVKKRNQTADDYDVVTQIFYRMDANYYEFSVLSNAVRTYRRTAVKNNSGSYDWTPWGEIINTNTQVGRSIVNSNCVFNGPSVSTGVWLRIAQLTADQSAANRFNIAKGSLGHITTFVLSASYNKYPSEVYKITYVSKWSNAGRLYQEAGRCSSTQHITKVRYVVSENTNSGYLDVYWVGEQTNTLNLSMIFAESNGGYWVPLPSPLSEVPETTTGEYVNNVISLHADFIPSYQLHDYGDDRRISMGYSYPELTDNDWWSFLAAWFDTGGNAGMQLRAVSPDVLGERIGKIALRPGYGSWIAGANILNAGLRVKAQMNDSSYYPIIAALTHTGNVLGFGAIYNRIGIFGWKADRIAAGTNGVDYEFYFDGDFRNGWWVFHNNGVYCNSVIVADRFLSTDSSYWQDWPNHTPGTHSCEFGSGTSASGDRSLAAGYNATASGSISFAFGNTCKATGANSFAAGNWSQAIGENSVALGSTAIAEGADSFAAGANGRAKGVGSVSFGGEAKGKYSLTAGRTVQTYEGAEESVVVGKSNYTTKEYSMVAGCYNNAWSIAGLTIGHICNNVTGSDSSGMGNKNGVAFCIGNGISSGDSLLMSNAFRIEYGGKVYAASTYTSNSADYAEYFEWDDQNPLFEDRVGLFVTMNGETIKIAESNDDYILGIVSGEPVVVGNEAYDEWYGRYLRDDFGRIMYERAPMIKENEETGELEIQYDEDGNMLYMGTKPIENPAYNPDEPYVPRSDRPEWAPVGMLGVLSVRQDGTITSPNCYCTCGAGGVATLCEGYNQNKYRVIKVISEEIVKVVFK